MRAVLAGLLLLALIETGVCDDKDSKGKDDKTIAYREVFRWGIIINLDFKSGGGKLKGTGKVIVVDPAYRNEEGLKRLGEQLKADTKEDQVSEVIIFDDEKAATNRLDAEAGKLSKDDLAHYNKHFIGSNRRSRDGSTLKMHLDGRDGKTVEIKY